PAEGDRHRPADAGVASGHQGDPPLELAGPAVVGHLVAGGRGHRTGLAGVVLALRGDAGLIVTHGSSPGAGCLTVVGSLSDSISIILALTPGRHNHGRDRPAHPRPP